MSNSQPAVRKFDMLGIGTLTVGLDLLFCLQVLRRPHSEAHVVSQITTQDQNTFLPVKEMWEWVLWQSHIQYLQKLPALGALR